MKKTIFFVFLFVSYLICPAQKNKADSLLRLLSVQRNDTSRAKLMWQLADATYLFNPDTALVIAQEGLYLAQNSNYVDGESRSLGILANIFLKISNYPKALDFYIRKLKIEETRKNPRALASVTMNIGIVYAFQEDYAEALNYYNKADSIIEAHNVVDFKDKIALNKGDLFDRTKKSDSAIVYFNKSLFAAKEKNDIEIIGGSKVGLGHSYVKKEDYPLALSFYNTAIPDLQKAENEDLLCEAYNGLAYLYSKINKNDSAILFSHKALVIARKSDFLSRQYDALSFLSETYKKKSMDSAFQYLTNSLEIKEKIYSNSKVKQLQILSSDEQLRQNEKIIEEKKKAKVRKKQLQLLFIGIFIPLFFLLTFLFSRIMLSTRIIRLMGIISLLLFFEYLTLWLHPFVQKITNHTPIYEILIFVLIAAFLIPAHHRLEHWFIEKITRKKTVTIDVPHMNEADAKTIVSTDKNKRRHKKPPHH